ncbi:MAG: hypothetical protein ACD_40C00300G0002 [uncultured bacterium]|nr:MAG: hypothetical protein ACD_40C00300G0002 [uncultured bacterium]
MHIMYVDESGDTTPLTQGGKKFLVLTGAIIHEKDVLDVEKKFRAIKQDYYQDPDVEIKSNFLRYANPDITYDSPIKLHDREKYNQLESEITKLLQTIPTTVISIVIDKAKYWSQYPSQNPYEIAYVFLLERFQRYLDKIDGLGITIIDPREGQVEKHFIGNEISDLHDKMRWRDGSVWHQCHRVIEKLLFSQSDKTVGIQLADLYCYPVFHMFEYNKKQGEYWRFDEITKKKLYSIGGKTEGMGLKYFPDKTKKDLRFFEDPLSMGAELPRPL